ncbi:MULTISPECIES: DUF1877 family protein [Ruminococcus]|uniref:DUF1877 domain-containing protein n=1 Tax=Ruminococcus albus (strain ATCC 27210 / DSM 20455 / JCM 14654 / NCDO 2250 / 7) TaxID=697329 RepID=E6UES8_RUMA7|nr:MULTISPECIES: DUF1877 family protein [Ruminococcus]ADU21847.1 Domain of unknown function DUF1877 [Ruminococcus albus 7 = DSM 20455]MCR5021426.1 YfbM family protein [Ruminococcus sp.]
MSCLGVLFAVPEDVVRKLGDMPLEERPGYISEELEDEYFEEYPERTYELDKSWDAMHRLLTDGTLCFGGEGPLAKAVLGGEVLYFDDDHDDYIITAKTPDEVRKVYEALLGLEDSDIKRRYFAIPADEYEDKGEEDFEYTLEYLQDSLSFWRYAAEHGLWVLFTADQ